MAGFFSRQLSFIKVQGSVFFKKIYRSMQTYYLINLITSISRILANFCGSTTVTYLMFIRNLKYDFGYNEAHLHGHIVIMRCKSPYRTFLSPRLMAVHTHILAIEQTSETSGLLMSGVIFHTTELTVDSSHF